MLQEKIDYSVSGIDYPSKAFLFFWCFTQCKARPDSMSIVNNCRQISKPADRKYAVIECNVDGLELIGSGCHSSSSQVQSS